MLAGSTGARPRVLLVEDDADYATLLHDAFTEVGFEVVHARNGEAALRSLRDQKVDLVVSDFMMPEINGLELCRLVSQDVALSLIRVVIYSCNGDLGFRKKARELGAIDYLPKSDDAKALVARICEVAGLRPSMPSNGHAAVDNVSAGISAEARQLHLLLDNLLDFVRIAGLEQPSSPAALLAREAVQRTAEDMKRVLGQMESSEKHLANEQAKVPV
jgi:DNA-binding response OmpR family regulator